MRLTKDEKVVLEMIKENGPITLSAIERRASRFTTLKAKQIRIAVQGLLLMGQAEINENLELRLPAEMLTDRVHECFK